MFTRDIKIFKTIYDYLKGLDSLFFLYVFFPLLSFSIAYLRLNNKKTGIAPEENWSIEMQLSIVVGLIAFVVFILYKYYQQIKSEIQTTVQKEIVIKKVIKESVQKEEEYYDDEEDDDENVVNNQQELIIEPTEETVLIKDIRQLLIKYRSIDIKMYQKYAFISLVVVGIFAWTNLAMFAYLYGVLVVVISLEKPTFSRVCKKLKLTKIERDYLLEANEIPE